VENLTGVFFNIVHSSFVDGYGVRTTLFLKGCPLRCLWCCNPEGQKFEPELKFIAPDCNGCGKCVEICPEGAISVNTEDPKQKLTIDRKKCTVCGKCVDACALNAFDIVGKPMTVEEVMKIIMKDEYYYRKSGGGVTIGGGEATSQPDFTLALVRACHENYLHVAIDTCGFTTTETGLKALEEADLLLFDVKGIDPVQHKNNTGVSNDLILKNLRHLDSIGKSIIIRYPFIPGYNDSRETVEAIVAELEKLQHIERVDIIGYHEYSKTRYKELGMPYPLEHVKNTVTNEQLESVKQYFIQHGLNTQLGG